MDQNIHCYCAAEGPHNQHKDDKLMTGATILRYLEYGLVSTSSNHRMMI